MSQISAGNGFALRAALSAALGALERVIVREDQIVRVHEERS